MRGCAGCGWESGGAGAGGEALAGLRCGWISIHPSRGFESVDFTIARVCDLSGGLRAGTGDGKVRNGKGKERKGKERKARPGSRLHEPIPI